MLFLLPPSETKQQGGTNLTISEVALIFGKLTEAREEVLTALLALCEDSEAAVKALKLGPKQFDEITTNLLLRSAPTMPAIDRYTGVLYDALKQGGLNPDQRLRAKENVLIQSALFGLISSSDRIPAYRLSASSSLPGINLKKLWNQAHEVVWPRLEGGVLIDMRSKHYAALAPIPKEKKHFNLEVLVEERDGTRKPLNHFNKRSKGLFLREVLLANSYPSSVAELKAIAKKIGMKLEQNGSELLLINFH
jgi:cytoplasmic iron level regulating protein YaaA (DUF328/UPF0246 family)